MVNAESRTFSRRRAVAGVGAGALCLAIGRSEWQSNASAQEPEVEYSVPYGSDETYHLMEIFIPPATDELRPAVILIHGGRWSRYTATRGDFSSNAQELARAGYVTFNIDYRLLGDLNDENSWPAQLDDVQRAVRWVRANAATYDVDPDRVGAYGHSVEYPDGDHFTPADWSNAGPWSLTFFERHLGR